MQPNEDKSLHASSAFNKYAKEYENKFMNVSLYADSLNLFCKLITKQNAKVLDLACGPGNMAKYLLDKRKDLVVSGIDLAPDMISLARHNNPHASFEVMDCRSIETLTEKFDGVLCSFCLPYLSIEETNKLIKNMSSLLNETGVCYISTMEGDYAKSGYETNSKGDLVFMHYYEAEYLMNELKKNNLKIADVSRKTSVMTNGKQVVDLVIISRKEHEPGEKAG